MEFEKYLPIGTVVLLKGGRKRVVIVGFLVISKENNKMYDYGAVLYPEGFISSDRTILFNHDQIDKVYYVGLEDDEHKGFMNLLRKIEVR